jgi:hypothetical protein
VIQAGGVQEVNFFLQGGNHAQVHIGLQYQSRMRMKGKQHRFSVYAPGHFTQAREYFSVADVHPIKRTGSYHGIVQGIKFFQAMVYVHAIVIFQVRKYQMKHVLP